MMNIPRFSRLLGRLLVLSITTFLCNHANSQLNEKNPIFGYQSIPPASAKTDKLAANLAAHNKNILKLRVLEQQIIFTNPSGYCTLGESAKEKELLAVSKQMLSSSAQLVHVGVKCDELEAYRGGRRDTLDHWMVIQLIGPKGEFKRLETSREAFLAGLANATPKLNMLELTRKINSQLNNLEIGMSNINVSQIGRDGNAFYISSSSNLMYGDKLKTVNSLGGITLVNALPLGIWIYESAGSSKSGDQLHAVLHQALVGLISNN